MEAQLLSRVASASSSSKSSNDTAIPMAAIWAEAIADAVSATDGGKRSGGVRTLLL